MPLGVVNQRNTAFDEVDGVVRRVIMERHSRSGSTKCQPATELYALATNCRFFELLGSWNPRACPNPFVCIVAGRGGGVECFSFVRLAFFDG